MNCPPQVFEVYFRLASLKPNNPRVGNFGDRLWGKSMIAITLWVSPVGVGFHSHINLFF